MKTYQIRKQPRRQSRKELRPYFKNPFLNNHPYFPAELVQHLMCSQFISLRDLQGKINIPNRLNQQLITQIKKAATQQQQAVEQLKKQFCKEKQAHNPQSTIEAQHFEEDRNEEDWTWKNIEQLPALNNVWSRDIGTFLDSNNQDALL